MPNAAPGAAQTFADGPVERRLMSGMSCHRQSSAGTEFGQPPEAVGQRAEPGRPRRRAGGRPGSVRLGAGVHSFRSVPRGDDAAGEYRHRRQPHEDHPAARRAHLG
jgi:hypothetical protein